MSKKAIIIIAILLVVIVVIIGVATFIIKRNNAGETIKEPEKYSMTVDEIYCNVKNSKKIAKVKISVETVDEEEVVSLSQKSFLIKDVANKIIRDSEEKDLEGLEGQVRLQEIIKEKLLEVFDSETISNVYFDEFVVQ